MILVSLHQISTVQELFPHTLMVDEGLVLADAKTQEILSDEQRLNEHGLEKP